MENIVAAAGMVAGRMHPELMKDSREQFGITELEEDLPSQIRKHLRFEPFTQESYQLLLKEEESHKIRHRDKKERAFEAHLIDGELKFGTDDDTLDKPPECNPDLEEGQSLKPEYGEPPAFYMGLPLEEIDKGVTTKTFVVLSRWLYRIHITRFSAVPACFVLPAWNPLRRIAVYLSTNQIFDFFILLTILINCICLAIPKLNNLPWLEYVFFCIYSAEMIIKMVARGIIFTKYTYLRDPWNWLDLIVIASGIPPLLLHLDQDPNTSGSNTGATQALRTFRVLRAVKTISIFPGLRTIVNAMLRAIRMLHEVVLMTMFCLLVFSLISVQIYKGTLRQKCVLDPVNLTYRRKAHEFPHNFYHRMVHTKENWDVDSDGNYVLCGNATGAGSCRKGYICQPNVGENPNFGFMSFDNIFWSLLITFQLMTIDFWENAYRKVLLTNGSLTVVFFILTVFFGSFYLLNLMLAVVTITYEEEAERTNKELEVERAAKRQRKQAVTAFYNVSSLATKQNLWAKLIQENKQKEKDKESPLQKLIRLRNTINKWKKVGLHFKSKVSIAPDCAERFEAYATESRSAAEIAQNVAYMFQKWRAITTINQHAHESSKRVKRIQFEFMNKKPESSLSSNPTWSSMDIDLQQSVSAEKSNPLLQESESPIDADEDTGKVFVDTTKDKKADITKQAPWIQVENVSDNLSPKSIVPPWKKSQVELVDSSTPPTRAAIAPWKQGQSELMGRSTPSESASIPPWKRGQNDPVPGSSNAPSSDLLPRSSNAPSSGLLPGSSNAPSSGLLPGSARIPPWKKSHSSNNNNSPTKPDSCDTNTNSTDNQPEISKTLQQQKIPAENIGSDIGMAHVSDDIEEFESKSAREQPCSRNDADLNQNHPSNELNLGQSNCNANAHDDSDDEKSPNVRNSSANARGSGLATGTTIENDALRVVETDSPGRPERPSQAPFRQRRAGLQVEAPDPSAFKIEAEPRRPTPSIMKKSFVFPTPPPVVPAPAPAPAPAHAEAQEKFADRSKFSVPGKTTLSPSDMKKIRDQESELKPKESSALQTSCETCCSCDTICKKCSMSCCNVVKRSISKFRSMIAEMVTDIFFDLFINFCIVMNTIMMCLEHHGMSSQLRGVINIGSIVFTALFGVEAMLKILGLGFRGYFASRWNSFDFIIAVVSSISVGLEKLNIGGIQFMRAFRVLRVLKLAQVWPAMNTLLAIIGNALSALGQLTFILLIILYIFAIIGLHLLKDEYKDVFFPGGIPRWNFSTFFHSFMLMFRVLCGEWIEPLWDCMQVTEVNNGICIGVFLPTLIFGNFVVLNLFLALLLNAFGSENTSGKENTTEVMRLNMARRRIAAKFQWFQQCSSKERKKTVIIHTPQRPTMRLDDDLDIPSNGDFSPLHPVSTGSYDSVAPSEADSSFLVPVQEEAKSRRGANRGLTMELWQAKQRLKTRQQVQEAKPCCPKFIRNRLYTVRHLFNQSSYGKVWIKFRLVVMLGINNDLFEYFILFLIIASSVLLAFEDYDFQNNINVEPQMTDFIHLMNYVFTVLFVIEMLLRWLGVGLSKYFTNVWTLIDFIVVVVSLMTVTRKTGAGKPNTFRAFRALRALRPLRVVSRIQGMKIVVNSLMRAIPAILNVFMVSLVFWLIFSVMGVQFFAGKFFKCIYLDSQSMANVTNKAECERQMPELQWHNSNINFDNVLNGFLALFQVATFEGWMEIMRDAVDSTEVDQQPKRESSLYTYLYFVAFIICGSFFSLNLVIGVIIDNFNVLKKKYEGSYLDAFLTLNQRNYYNTLKKMSTRKPQRIITPPKNHFQQVFYDLSVSDRFELIVMGVVLLNLIALGVEFYEYKMTCVWREVLWILEIAFCTFFALEAVLKIVGLRQHYFTLPWNVYDFVVALLSIISVILHVNHMFEADEARKREDYGEFMRIQNSLLFPPIFLRILRIFRISRVLRIIKVAKGLRKVMFSLVISLPATINIMALLLLCIFIYAVFGMFLFANTKLTGALTKSMNFRSWKNSVLLLLSLSTAAGWNDVLEPLLIAPPFCNNTHHRLPDGTWDAVYNGDCGTGWIAIPYMVSYIIITYLFIINMYIAVILENYNQAHQQEEVGVTEDDFDMFYSVWQRYDPDATQFIPYAMLSDFVADLDPPLGIEKPNEIALVSINLPILEGDRLHCLDILHALVKNVLSDFDESDEMFTLKRQINTRFTQRFPSRAKMNIISTTIQRKKEDVAARTLQKAWQVFKTRMAINHIMKLAVKDRATYGDSETTRTMTTVEELSHNLGLACTRYFHNLLDASSLTRPRPRLSAINLQGQYMLRK